MLKKGQLQLSFGMIFSLILIIGTLAVTGYVLIKYAGLFNTVSCTKLFDDVQSDITRAWQGDGATFDSISIKVPSKITKVCFGNVSLSPNPKDQAAYNSVKFYSTDKSNIFLYPLDSKACDSSPTQKRIDHVSNLRFFCVNVKDKKAYFNISKKVTEDLVTISP